MACSLKSVFYVPKLNENMLLDTKSKGVLRLCPSRHVEAKSSTYYNLRTSRVVSINVCKSFIFLLLIALLSCYFFFLYINSMFFILGTCNKLC